MAGIRPGEVSDVLKKQLEGITTDVQLEEVGTVSINKTVERL